MKTIYIIFTLLVATNCCINGHYEDNICVCDKGYSTLQYPCDYKLKSQTDLFIYAGVFNMLSIHWIYLSENNIVFYILIIANTLLYTPLIIIFTQRKKLDKIYKFLLASNFIMLFMKYITELGLIYFNVIPDGNNMYPDLFS